MRVFDAIYRWHKVARLRQAYVDYYIVLPGEHALEIEGIIGLSLHKVTRHTYMKHRGLKYWIESPWPGRQADVKAQEVLSRTARLDVINKVFGKRCRPFLGIVVETKR